MGQNNSNMSDSDESEEGLTNEEVVEESREIFDLIDLDGGGSLDAEEMMKLMDMLGMMALEEEVYELIEQIDTTGEGEVFFEDFVKATNKKVEVDYGPKDVLKAFDFFSKSFHRSN